MRNLSQFKGRPRVYEAEMIQNVPNYGSARQDVIARQRSLVILSLLLGLCVGILVGVCAVTGMRLLRTEVPTPPVLYSVDIGDEEAPSCWEDETPPWMLKILYGPDEAPACWQGDNEPLSTPL